MKKIIGFFVLFLFIFNYIVIFSDNNLIGLNLYYSDTDNNGKIDRLEIEFNNELTGSLNFDKLFLYSNTGGLSASKLDDISGNSIFKSYFLSGNILAIDLQEQDNTLTGLFVNNGTSSQLRLKTHSGVGVKDLSGNEIKLFYTSSFSNYKNVFFKESLNVISNPEILQDTSNEQVINPEILSEDETGSLELSQTGVNNIEVSSGNVINSDLIINSGSTDNKTLTGTFNSQILENISTGSQNTLNSEVSSGNVINSDLIINSGSTDNKTLTGTFNSQILENISTGSQKSILNSKILFQNPSYILQKDNTGIINYTCDRTKTDCKVNFNLEIDFGSGFVSVPTSIYSCNWNFGFGEITEEENKCNPNTITYPVGNFETTYRIYEKSNPSNYIEKKIYIKNEGFKEESVVKTVYVSSASSPQNSSQNIDKSIYIDIPKIVVQSGLDENKVCKNIDCSLNLFYEQKNSKEACIWSFPGGNYEAGTEKKCNPGYVKYPPGDFKVTLRVYEVGNETNYKESYLYFSNRENKTKSDEKPNEKLNEKLDIKSDEKPNNEKSKEIIAEAKHILENKDSNEDNLSLENKEVVLSFSGLIISSVLANPIGKDDNEWIELTNNSNNSLSLSGCELDYKLKKSTKKFKIKKDFVLKPGENIKFYKKDTSFSIRNSSGASLDLYCNNLKLDSFVWNFDTPEGFVVTSDMLDLGITKVSLDKKDGVFLLNYEDGSKEEVFFTQDASGFGLQQVAKEEKVDSGTSNLKSIIELQGKLSKNKILKGNKLICIDVDFCSVNFDGRSSKGEKLSYFWDFGNGKTFSKPNPAAYNFPVGRHIISLTVSSGKFSDTSYFIVDVLGKETKKSTKNKKDETNNISKAEAKYEPSFTEEKDDISFTKKQVIMSFILFLFGISLFLIILKKKTFL